MANDDPVNKSSKPVNGGSSSWTDRLKDIYRARADVGGEQSDKAADMAADYKKAKEEVEAHRITSAPTDRIGEYTWLAKLDRLNVSAASKSETWLNQSTVEMVAANTVASSAISTMGSLKNINQRTTHGASSPAIYNRLLGKNKQGSNELYTPDIIREQNIASSMEKLVPMYARQAVDQITHSNEENGEWSDLMKERAGKISYLERGISINKRAQKEANKRGLTTEKQYDKNREFLNDVDSTLGRQRIRSGETQGQYKNVDEAIAALSSLTKTFEEAEKKWKESSEKLIETTNDSTKSQQQKNDATKEHAGIAKDMNTARDEAEGARQSVRWWKDDQNQRKDNFNRVGYYGQAVASMANSAQTMFVNQDTTQMGNRASFAALGNQMYAKANSAVSDYNMDAAIDLITNNQSTKERSDHAEAWTNVTGWTSAIAGGVTEIVGKTVAGGVIGNVPGAIVGAADGVMNTVADLSALGHGEPQAAAKLGVIGAWHRLGAEGRKMQTFHMQKYMNQTMSSYGAVQGMGGQAAGMQSALVGGAGLGEAGIGMEESLQLAGILKQAGDFGGSASGMRTIKAAGQAARFGVMSKSEYVSGVSRLQGAGGSDSELQDIITKGMENATNINKMVDASIGLSAGLSSMGIAGTGAVAGYLGSTVNSLKANGVSENIAVNTAASSMQNLSSQFKSGAMTFGNITERGMIRGIDSFRGASVHQMNRLSELSAEELMVLKTGAGPNATADQIKAATDLSGRKGFRDMIVDQDGKIKGKDVNKLVEAGVTGMVMDAGGIGELPNILKGLRTGKGINQRGEALLSGLGITKEGLYNIGNNGGASVGKKDLVELDGFQSEQLGKQREWNQAALGGKYAKDLDSSKSAYQNITTILESIDKAFDPEEFSKEVARAAKGFKAPVGDFGIHVKTLEGILNTHKNFLKDMGENRGSTSTIPSKAKLDIATGTILEDEWLWK